MICSRKFSSCVSMLLRKDPIPIFERRSDVIFHTAMPDALYQLMPRPSMDFLSFWVDPWYLPLWRITYLGSKSCTICMVFPILIQRISSWSWSSGAYLAWILMYLDALLLLNQSFCSFFAITWIFIPPSIAMFGRAVYSYSLPWHA